MKYICLGYYEPAKLTAMTEDERNAMFDECFEYDDYLRANGHGVVGEATETALSLYWKNDRIVTTDGPYAETKEQLGGIDVLEARDMNYAIQLMSQHPAVKYGTLWEIRPALKVKQEFAAKEKAKQSDKAQKN